jgi:hypothetical protein
MIYPLLKITALYENKAFLFLFLKVKPGTSLQALLTLIFKGDLRSNVTCLTAVKMKKSIS